MFKSIYYVGLNTFPRNSVLISGFRAGEGRMRIINIKVKVTKEHCPSVTLTLKLLKMFY
jgi:hypothetical protein